MEEFDYPTLFKFAFPEWNNPVPELRKTYNVNFPDSCVHQKDQNESENILINEEKDEVQNGYDEASQKMDFLSDDDDYIGKQQLFGPINTDNSDLQVNQIQNSASRRDQVESNMFGIEFSTKNIESRDVFLWEVISSEKCSNIDFSKHKNSRINKQQIQYIKLYSLNGDCIQFTSDDIIPQDSLNIIPNATWVFSLEPDICIGREIYDPFIALWLENTESFVDPDIVMPITLIEGANADMKKHDLLHFFASLYEKFRLIEDIYDWYTKVELPHLRIVGSMHLHSFKIDIPSIATAKKCVEKEIESIKKEIFQLSKDEFNVFSPFEVSDVLFKKMNLKSNISWRDASIDSRHRISHHKEFLQTNTQSLEAINHPIVPFIIKCRSLQKLASNWLSFQDQCDEEGELHPWILVNSTATGRVSMRLPNLQNIPSGIENGFNIRRFFNPRSKRHTLVSVGYSHLELRILAHFSQDNTLLDLVKKTDIDVHKKIATYLFSTDDITEEMRNETKTLINATINGKGRYAGKNDKMKDILDIFPGIKRLINHTINEATSNGYVSSICGKRRKLPNLSSSSIQNRKRDERIAINSLIQGTAADYVKFSLLNIVSKTNIHAILQLHDEWIFETECRPESFDFQSLVKSIKSGAECSYDFGLTVPTPTKISIGNSYGDLHEYEVQ